MIKKIIVLLLALVYLLPSALADGVPWSTDMLPQCYRYPIEGANIVYADAPVPVYTNSNLAGTPIGYVYPNQHIHVQAIDRGAHVVNIKYYENDTQTGWNFAGNASYGWISALYTTWITDAEPAWVVITDQPGDRLNLRAKPSKNSVSLGKFYAGAIVRQIEPPSGGYVKVRTPHMTGYMDLRYVQQGLYTETAELPMLTVTCQSGISLHKMPADNSEIIKFVPYDSVVTALAVRDDGWVLVVYENETGYTPGRCMSPRLEY